jgi:hypothetical protein
VCAEIQWPNLIDLKEPTKEKKMSPDIPTPAVLGKKSSSTDDESEFNMNGNVNKLSLNNGNVWIETGSSFKSQNISNNTNSLISISHSLQLVSYHTTLDPQQLGGWRQTHRSSSMRHNFDANSKLTQSSR